MGQGWILIDYMVLLIFHSLIFVLCWSNFNSLQKLWGMTCIATEDNVDVLVSGYAFRLKILHERGLSLLSKESMGFNL